MTRVILADHSWLFPRLDEVKKQNGSEGDGERSGDQGCRLRSERVRESVLDNVDSRTKERQDEEGGEATESARESSSNNERFGRALHRSVVQNFEAHDSVLARNPPGECRLVEM